MAITGMTCGWIADWLINSKRLTVTTTRKLFQFIGHWVPSTALLILAYGINCGDHIFAVVLLCIAVGFNGASFSGYQVTISSKNDIIELSFIFSIITKTKYNEAFFILL